MGSQTSHGNEAQHSQARQRAHEVKRARSKLKGEIARGERSVPQVVVACPSHAAAMSVGELLMCQKRWGSERSRRLLVATGIAERTALGNLTERQRTAMAAVFELRAGRGGDRL